MPNIKHMDSNQLFDYAITIFTNVKRLPLEHPSIKLQRAILGALGEEIACATLREYITMGNPDGSNFFSWTTIMQIAHEKVATANWATAEQAWEWVAWAIQNNRSDLPNQAPLNATLKQLGGIEKIRATNAGELRNAFIGIYRKIVKQHTKELIGEQTKRVFS